MAAQLIAFCGLPGVGKTTLARELARQMAITYIRIDSVETAMKVSTLNIYPAEDAGYLASLAVAGDNLKNGLSVVTEAVNPIALTRRWWLETAQDSNAQLINVEVICSDRVEHQRRVETRLPDIDGLHQPTWQAVLDRHYEPWLGNDVLRIDTTGRNVQDCVTELRAAIAP